MKQTGTQSDHSRLEGLDHAGTGRVFWNLGMASLCERAVARGEVRLSEAGALVVTTVQSGQEISLVRVDDTARASGEPLPETVSGYASVLTRAQFEALKTDLLAYVGRRTLFGQDLCVEAGAGQRLPLRVLSDQAWHALLSRHLMRPCEATDMGETVPRLTVLCAPGFRPTPETHGVAADGAIALDLANGLALIAGTARSEAIRAALARLIDGPLTDAGVLPLDGVAAIGTAGRVALFLGTAGAGKSTLAGALARGQGEDGAPARLVDGALGWGEDGLVALENAAYARPADLARLAHEAPGFGAVLENIALDPASRTPDLAEAANTDVSRVILAQPSTDGAREPKLGPPAQLFVLVQDASGALPAIARLNPAQALAHCLACMDATPALAELYGPRLHDLLAGHAPGCWLVNTGWIGGAAGVGRRVSLEASRRLVDAAQAGELATGDWRTDPHFGFEVPTALEGIDPRLLDPARAFANRSAHDAAARALAGEFAARLARLETALGEEARDTQPGMAVAAE
ncbi:phosphoenolpyruvate carboxykinase (ATP) [Ancylobacter vacuolatus]|uniref:phosphoenolpyruvate carboxykinase (ATP) n=1 Tax=Ancylobacter vacuolatus TaxID=223389 RepID=A0ABU0DMJ4_9HYPH|nr:phosphoenolpyruvate carboxykinase (ATP) [Ancylobacter vacuolatus]MDQ0349610.1 phosphoenolpyruvate carboxykinase (ATP) [Ancylobacter vacuolatus]